ERGRNAKLPQTLAGYSRQLRRRAENIGAESRRTGCRYHQTFSRDLRSGALETGKRLVERRRRLHRGSSPGSAPLPLVLRSNVDRVTAPHRYREYFFQVEKYSLPLFRARRQVYASPTVGVNMRENTDAFGSVVTSAASRFPRRRARRW